MNNTQTKPEPYDGATVLTFGKFKGKKLANVPAQYLLYTCMTKVVTMYS
jgi:hypothetical protein